MIAYSSKPPRTEIKGRMLAPKCLICQGHALMVEWAYERVLGLLLRELDTHLHDVHGVPWPTGRGTA